jgi:exo-poly-alpha-galacturonosidase
MNTTHLSAAMTATTAELYWKPAAEGHAVYTILLDGAVVGQTQKTHFTVTGLAPQRAYAVAVTGGTSPALSICITTSPQRRRLDVTRPPYCAKGDGKTLNTAVLQKALDDCTEADEVYFPAGCYLTGALNLHSHIAVFLDEGAVLQGSDDPQDYLPRIWSRFEGTEQECYRSLLNAGQLDHAAGPNCEDILLYGSGTISGGGRVLAERIIDSERERLKDYLAANAALVATCENDRTIPGRVRGRLINLSNCAHVRISGLTLQNGACWNVHMVYSDDILTDHCVLRSTGIWNGDGWDPDSSTNCTLFATVFATEDDSVAIKSGKNPQGNIIDRPTKHIRVFDCQSLYGHGICIGSEMSGGVEDVKIWDCDISESSNGIEIKGTPKSSGYVRDICVQNCSFPRLLIHAVPYNDDGVPAPQPPIFENFRFEGLHLTGLRKEHGTTECVAPMEIAGFEAAGHEVRHVVCKNLVLPSGAPLLFSRYSGLTLENIVSEDTV